MNKIGEKIQIENITKHCRYLDVKELLALLKFDLMKFWSWGANNFTVDKKEGTKMFRMTVNGHHHKGHVYIFVNGADLFDVYLTTNRGTIKQIGEGLYFDMLVDWIDEKIERVDEYVH
jgi:hypothetical protein